MIAAITTPHCPFRSNSFCSMLGATTLQDLCRHCHVQKIKADTEASFAKWEDRFVILLRGLVSIKAPTSDNKSHRMSSPLVTPGTIVSSGPICYDAMDVWSCPLDFISDTYVASFSGKLCEQIYESSIDFSQAMLYNILAAWGQSLQLESTTNIVDHVRLIIQWTHSQGMNNLTHDQIARACGHSRQSVTQAMGELLKNSPELFVAPRKAEGGSLIRQVHACSTPPLRSAASPA